MKQKQSISQCRERLDRTLLSHDLTNGDTVKTLVKDQLLQSSKFEREGYNEKVLDKRTMQVSNILGMLRTGAVNDDELSKARETTDTGWKLKQDNEEYRVMYREGPPGTPFHTLLVEGYVEGPLDVCLCVSWESTLYKKWWPQLSLPTFKIISSQCLQKIRIGEQICLVRMKVSWPLSAREAVVHYFEFDYFQDDLIIILLNTIPDSEKIDISTHGFPEDGIPEAKDIVRIDAVGGFALQKVDSNRSYFRTIANMDMKLDFVPPSLINFISRQIIGSGFKLYQKAIASVAKGDEDFIKALKDPLYVRIREALYSTNKPNKLLYLEDLEDNKDTCPKENLIGTIADDTTDTKQKVLGEIEEEQTDESRHREEAPNGVHHFMKIQVPDNYCRNDNLKSVCIRPKVEEALGTLEKVISLVREVGFNDQSRYTVGFTKHEEVNNLEKDDGMGDLSSSNNGLCSDNMICIEVSKEENANRTLDEPRNSSGRYKGSKSCSREMNHNRIAPATPEMNLPILSETQLNAQVSSKSCITDEPMFEKTINFDKQLDVEANGIHEKSSSLGNKQLLRNKKRYCCFAFPNVSH